MPSTASRSAHEAPQDPQETTLAVLYPEGLLDKWGFGDGDMADHWVNEWAQTAWPATHLDGPQPEDAPIWTYLNSRALLGAAIRTLLMPTLDISRPIPVPGTPLRARFQLTHVASIHNPWRLLVKDWTDHTGTPVATDTIPDTAWDWAESEASRILEASPPATVTREWLHDTAPRVYPYRSIGWTHVMRAMLWHADTIEAFPAGETEDWYTRLTQTTDLVTQNQTEDALILAAELITNAAAPGDRISINEITSIISAATLATQPDH